jgi:hypothetical protein
MDRYARSWMFFLQTNVCILERTPHAPSLMLQVAGRGYAELLRKPRRRSSQNFPSPQLVAQSFKATMDATPEEIAEILGMFECYLIEERRDLDVRRETRPRPSILQIGHCGCFASSPTSFVEPEEGDILPARSSKRVSRDPLADRPSSCASFVTASRPHLRGSGTRAQQPRSHPLAVRPAR